MNIRKNFAIAICQLVHKLMRLAGKNGRSLPGKIALRIDSNIIEELSRNCKSIVITGTNGKTTTTHIIQQAILNVHGTAAFDPTSTNLEQGIATTLCLDSAVGGKRKSEWAVIECDEGATKSILPQMYPQVMVVTNLYRDQIDRYASQTTARDYIVEAAKSSPETILVLNADCQVTASIAEHVENPIIWFGMDCSPYEDGIADFDDVVECVKCSSVLEYQSHVFAHLGEWECPGCGRRRPDLDLSCEGVPSKGDTSCSMMLSYCGKDVLVEANVRAGYDVCNVVAAISALQSIGMNADEIYKAVGKFKHAAHRFEIFDVDGTPVRLLLAKNTAGCNQLVNMLASESELSHHFVCLLGTEIMDGSSTEWIEDVRWEKIIENDTDVVVGGPAYGALTARLRKTATDVDKIRIETNYDRIIDYLTSVREPVTVIANCSTIEALRERLVRKYEPQDYWGS